MQTKGGVLDRKQESRGSVHQPPADGVREELIQVPAVLWFLLQWKDRKKKVCAKQQIKQIKINSLFAMESIWNGREGKVWNCRRIKGEERAERAGLTPAGNWIPALHPLSCMLLKLANSHSLCSVCWGASGSNHSGCKSEWLAGFGAKSKHPLGSGWQGGAKIIYFSSLLPALGKNIQWVKSETGACWETRSENPWMDRL